MPFLGVLKRENDKSQITGGNDHFWSNGKYLIFEVFDRKLAYKFHKGKFLFLKNKWLPSAATWEKELSFSLEPKYKTSIRKNGKIIKNDLGKGDNFTLAMASRVNDATKRKKKENKYSRFFPPLHRVVCLFVSIFFAPIDVDVRLAGTQIGES